MFNLAELTLFFIELPENCIYLNQSELSDFFRYLIIVLQTTNEWFALWKGFL